MNTSSYKNYSYIKMCGVSISGDRGKRENYVGECFPALAPKLSFWKVWHANIGKISEEENNRYYMEKYYEEVLSKLDPEEIFNRFQYSTLLCYEDNMEFCHRHIVAAWLELLLDVTINEIKCVDGKYECVSRPEYIKEELETIMKKNKNMRGFHSLRAVYLFESAENLESIAREIGETEDSYYDYMQAACNLRCDADEAELKYNQEHKIKRRVEE